MANYSYCAGFPILHSSSIFIQLTGRIPLIKHALQAEQKQKSAYLDLHFLFDTSHQQYFSYIGTGLPGLNQY